MQYPKFEFIDTNAKAKCLRRKLEYFSFALIILTFPNYNNFSTPEIPNSTLLVIFKYFVEHGHYITSTVLFFIVLYLLLLHFVETIDTGLSLKKGKNKYALDTLATPIESPKDISKENIEEFLNTSSANLARTLKMYGINSDDSIPALIKAFKSPILINDFLKNKDKILENPKKIKKNSSSPAEQYLFLLREINLLNDKQESYQRLLTRLRKWSPSLLGAIALFMSAHGVFSFIIAKSSVTNFVTMILSKLT